MAGLDGIKMGTFAQNVSSIKGNNKNNGINGTSTFPLTNGTTAGVTGDGTLITEGNKVTLANGKTYTMPSRADINAVSDAGVSAPKKVYAAVIENCTTEPDSMYEHVDEWRGMNPEKVA